MLWDSSYHKEEDMVCFRVTVVSALISKFVLYS